MPSVVISLFIVSTLILGVYSGTTFTVSSSDDLVKLASEASTTTYDTVVLVNDIDMSGKTNFIPIGDSSTRKFTTFFDGGGHIIRNLQLTNDGKDVGVIGYLYGGTVQNLVVDRTCNITSTASYTSYVTAAVSGVIGRVVSSSKSSKIERVVSMATVKFIGDLTSYSVVEIGGIVGSCEGSYATSITNCVNYGPLYFGGSVDSDNEINMGGIVGLYNGGGSSTGISGCINYGDVVCTGSSTDKTYVGGIIGYPRSKFMTENIVNFGSVTSNKGTTGSLIGSLYEATATTSGSYWKEGTAAAGAYGDPGSVSDTSQSFDSSLTLKDGTSLLDKLGSEYTLLKFDEPGVEDMILRADDLYPVLPTPTRNGDSFLGWYMESGLSTQFDKSLLKAGEMNLYGKWSSGTGGEPAGDNPGGEDPTPDPPTPTPEPQSSSSSSSIPLQQSSSSSSSSSIQSEQLPSSSSSSSIHPEELPSPLSSSSSSSYHTPSRPFPISPLPTKPTSSSSSSIIEIEPVDNGTVFVSQESSDESESVDKPNWTSTGSCYVIYILDKQEYSVKLTKINAQIDLSKPSELPIGHTFTGWYTDENLTAKPNFTKMPQRNVTLYGETFTDVVIVEFDTRVITSEEDVYGHIIKLLDDMCEDCYVIKEIITDNGKFKVILRFKDVCSARSFLEIIQSDPKVAKVEFVDPFRSAGEGLDKSEQNNGPFVALIVIFALLLVIVIAVALVMYPFLIRSGRDSRNYDSEKDAGIEMSDNTNYFDDNDDGDGYNNNNSHIEGYGTRTFDDTSYASNLGNTTEGAITATMSICDSVGPSVVDRVVPVKINYDSGAYPTSQMKIDSIYTDDYVPPQPNASGIQNALISAGFSPEESQRIVSSALGGGAEMSDPFAPIRVYAYDDVTNDVTNDVSDKRVPNVINGALIGGGAEELRGIRDILFLVMGSLRRMPVEQDLTLYCGSRMKVTSAPGYSKGNFVFWPGFASATTDRGYAMEMLRGKDGREEHGTLFVIEHGCGYRMRGYGKMGPGEVVGFEEILIEPERKFCVREVVKESKKISVVVLDMVDSPPPMRFDDIV